MKCINCKHARKSASNDNIVGCSLLQQNAWDLDMSNQEFVNSDRFPREIDKAYEGWVYTHRHPKQDEHGYMRGALTNFILQVSSESMCDMFDEYSLKS